VLCLECTIQVMEDAQVGSIVDTPAVEGQYSRPTGARSVARLRSASHALGSTSGRLPIISPRPTTASLGVGRNAGRQARYMCPSQDGEDPMVNIHGKSGAISLFSPSVGIGLHIHVQVPRTVVQRPIPSILLQHRAIPFE